MNAPANNNAAQSGRQLAPIDEFRQTLDKMQPQFRMALPPHVPVEKFVRVVATAVQQTPDLLNCDRKSLYGASMRCAQDGLLPDGREAALVKFRNNVGTKQQPKWEDHVTYMPMVAGILKKVRNSGELLTISAHVVYENDHFNYVLGDDEKIEHKPLISGERGKPTLTYAIAKTKDGGIYREIMTEDQIQAVRQVSRAKDSGPWSGSFADEMRRKTVIRRLSKRLPMSTDLEDLIRRDDELYDFGQPQQTRDLNPTPPEQQAGKSTEKRRRPRALDRVAQAGGTPAPTGQAPAGDEQPATIEGQATREPEQREPDLSPI